MKKISFSFFVLLVSFFAKGQNEKYVTSMTELSQIIQNQREGSLVPTLNKMERIATAEPKEWLPNYWMVYGLIQETYRIQNNDEKDILLDKASKFLSKAEEISPKNSELAVLSAYHNSARTSIDPMSRWEKYGALYEKNLAEAQSLDAGNPRADYLRAVNTFYTPESFGGGKARAKPLFESAVKKAGTFKNPTSYSPTWGDVESKYFLGQY